MTFFTSSNPSLSSVSVAGREVTRGDNGLFEIADCTPEIEFAMINHAGCTPASPEQVDQASNTASDASVRESKKTMIEALIAKGVKIDGRASFDAVLALFEKHIATPEA
jgi:hypothetical protein